MSISEQIRKAAVGPTPEPTFSCGVMVADWVGARLQHTVLAYKEGTTPYFSGANDVQQRTFLLLVAEALK